MLVSMVIMYLLFDADLILRQDPQKDVDIIKDEKKQFHVYDVGT